MCGIFSTTDADRWRTRVDHIQRSLHLRGPDAHGHAEVDGVLFVHTRLAILGLGEAGRQPAVSQDGRVTVVFNGEIYNFREVARRLGLPDLTSDTQLLAEVLARDSEQLGTLRGMYAFVAWDSARRQVLAARDPFGIKPLYLLKHSSGELSFASQLPTLLVDSDAQSVDRVGLGTYLASGHTGPGLTCLSAISKLEPGRLHTWRRSRRGLERSVRCLVSQPTLTDSVEEALRDSVRAHMVADVEVGTFLSGGIDSTLLTHLAAQEHPHVRSFTVSFPEAPGRDESALSSHNARLIGTEHTAIPATTADMAGAARAFLSQHGEPFADPAMLPLTLLSQAVGRELKVVLCGEGADELFGGYARYRVSNWMQAAHLLPLPARQRAADWWGSRRGGRPWQRALEAGLASGGFRSHSALLDGDLPLLGDLDPGARRDVTALASSGWTTSADAELGRARHYDIDTWLPQVYLEKADRSTMAGSLEGRLPFLDAEVAAAARREPLRADTSKAALRQLLLQWLPGVQLPDRKRGLAIDTRALVTHHFAAQVEHQLVDPLAALSRWRGSIDDGRARRRCSRSATFAFRLAMLDEWQTMFGNTLAWRVS